MDEYRRERSAYDVAMIQRQNKKDEATANKALPPLPPALDFEKLAKQNGLTSGETKLISQWEAQNTQIGVSFVGMRDTVARYAFLTLAKFHPAQSMDLLGDRYLFWKTEETKDRVPEFTDKGMREGVLRAWKMVHARTLGTEGRRRLGSGGRQGAETAEAGTGRPAGPARHYALGLQLGHLRQCAAGIGPEGGPNQQRGRGGLRRQRLHAPPSSTWSPARSAWR